MSNRDELRFGTNGSVAVPLSGPKRVSFYDFETGVGGGVLDMIRHRTGCSKGAAMDWLKSHGFVAATNETQRHSGHREARRVAAVYTYTDADGKPLYRKLGYHPKTFFFERADGRGGWVSGRGVLDGVPRTLYRLADLKRAPASTTIFVTEGEKAADSLADRLLIATAAGGATAWRPEFAEHFQGRRVCVLPYNDAAGVAYAEAVARNAAGVPKSVAVLPLAGLAAGADVFDWFAASRTAEELENMAEAAPPRQPGTADQPKPDADADVWDAGSDAYKVPPRAWLLGTTFCRRFISAILADGGVGKTALRIAQLMSLAIGRSLTGEHVHQRCRVLIVSLEDDKLRSASCVTRARTGTDAVRRQSSTQGPVGHATGRGAPAISVCIPAYEMHGGGAVFLARSLAALDRQTFPGFEVVVSDHSQDIALERLCRRHRQSYKLRCAARRSAATQRPTQISRRDTPRPRSSSCCIRTISCSATTRWSALW